MYAAQTERLRIQLPNAKRPFLQNCCSWPYKTTIYALTTNGVLFLCAWKLDIICRCLGISERGVGLLIVTPSRPLDRHLSLPGASSVWRPPSSVKSNTNNNVRDTGLGFKFESEKFKGQSFNRIFYLSLFSHLRGIRQCVLIGSYAATKRRAQKQFI